MIDNHNHRNGFVREPGPFEEVVTCTQHACHSSNSPTCGCLLCCSSVGVGINTAKALTGGAIGFSMATPSVLFSFVCSTGFFLSKLCCTKDIEEELIDPIEQGMAAVETEVMERSCCGLKLRT